MGISGEYPLFFYVYSLYYFSVVKSGARAAAGILHKFRTKNLCSLPSLQNKFSMLYYIQKEKERKSQNEED